MPAEFKIEEEIFEGRELITVFPEKPNGRWALKTEYFDAFPAVQDELVRQGYYVVHLKTNTRWHEEKDSDLRAKLAGYMHEKYNVSKKCVIIGMSCGGMQGIYFAAKYPMYVSCMYLDAPVVNLLSCPAGLGKMTEPLMKEFEEAKGMSLIELLSYRNHPLDHIPELVKHKIPLMLVSGDADTVVPFDENGELLKNAYEKEGLIIETIIKKGGDHHPHSLDDNTPILEFIRKYDVD